MFGSLRGPVAGKYLFFTLSPAVPNLRRINERGGGKTQTHLLELPVRRFVITRMRAHSLTCNTFRYRREIVETLQTRHAAETRLRYVGRRRSQDCALY